MAADTYQLAKEICIGTDKTKANADIREADDILSNLEWCAF